MTHPSAVLLAVAVGFSQVAWVSPRCHAQNDNAEDETAQDDNTQTGSPRELGRPSLTDPIGEVATPVDDYVTPDMVARDAFEPPPGAKPLTKSNLWVDRKRQRVYLDGYVAMNDGLLEMFACPMGTKEHESVIGTLPRAREVHAALLAIGAKPGKPVQFLPEFVPASGQKIRVWVAWLDQEGKYQVSDARRWVKKVGTEKSMTAEWVFAGSSFWEDPEDGRKYYRADSGDMICVSNFSTAMLDINSVSSAEADELLFAPFTERIPERFTPVRLVLTPIPEKADPQPQKQGTPADARTDKDLDADPLKPPAASILPPRKSAGATSTK